jgi:hypothetical protein
MICGRAFWERRYLRCITLEYPKVLFIWLYRSFILILSVSSAAAGQHDLEHRPDNKVLKE